MASPVSRSSDDRLGGPQARRGPGYGLEERIAIEGIGTDRLAARTDAVRGTLRSSEISPTPAPGPSRRIGDPAWLTSTSPLATSR